MSNNKFCEGNNKIRIDGYKIYSSLKLIIISIKC